jgi:hypothetical protein
MTTIARRPKTTPTANRRIVVSCPLWVAVVCSRLIVFATGAGGALFTGRVAGWQQLDPQRLSSSLGSVGNVMAASVFRWDAVGYVRIAVHGYTGPRSTVLFPLYPLLIRVVAIVVGSPVVAGVLISLVAFTVGLALVHRIASEEIGRRAGDATVLLLAFAPFSFVFSAVYTESLLLACMAGAFHLARRGRFVLACITAAAATLTHVQGILLVAPLAVLYWRSRDPRTGLRRLWSPKLTALTLPPVALAGFFVYAHMRGWGWLAPITNQNAAYAARTLVGPPIVLLESVKDAVTGISQSYHGIAAVTGGPFAPGFQNLIYLVVFAITILALVSALRRLPNEYALFAVLAILICASSAVAMEPLKGFDRYMLPIFPLWIGAAAWLQERRLMPIVLTITTVLLVFYTVEFTRWISVF